jgi:SAM-dependent methyltransferase
VTIPLARLGYDMIGIDISSYMLAQAREKAFEADADILFLEQDIRELDLYGTIDAAVCVCDGMNYLLCEEDLNRVFKRVSLFLNGGGLFIFDMNTEYKFKEVNGEKTFADSTDGAAYIWKNSYNAETRVNEYSVTFHVKDPSGNVESFSETHRQKAYPAETVTDLLKNTGFNILSISDSYSENPPSAESERLTFVSIKQQNIP